MAKDLNQFEIDALKALYICVGGSLSGHVPLEAIASKFRKDKRGLVKKAIGRLLRLGLAVKHPGAGVSYFLSREGKNYIESL